MAAIKNVEAVKWLIESKLKWSEEEIKKKITLTTFAENDLYRLIELFEYSAAKAVMEAYPGKYVLWEFRKVPKEFWNLETGIQATRLLIEEKLHWNSEEIENKLTRKVFEDNGLSGMLQIGFHRDIHQAINAAYPHKFRV